MTKILIVDDDPINLKLFSILAEKNQWTYDTADTGTKAQKLLQEKQYQLVLLDIQLPEIDGFTLLAQMRKNNVQSHVIAVTAHAMAGDKEKILAKGADSYLPKPINIEELIAEIKKVLAP